MAGKRVMMVAGEASGDAHAAALARELLRLRPELELFGVGGAAMRAAGVEIRVDAAELAVVGLVEVLRHYRRLKGILTRLQETLRRERPDLLILTDYPDFNLRLAKTAKAVGVKVLYYVSPQVWAWRQGRVKTIGERIDHMAVLFPFEVEIYQRAGIPVTFVGHPLVDHVRIDTPRAEAARALGLDPARPVVGLFPGSRRSELHRLLPLLIDAARELRRRDPAIQFITPRATTLADADFAPLTEATDLAAVQLRDRPYEAMRACDAIATASGTATLEIALVGTPMAIVYRLAPLSYAIMKRLIRVPHIGLVNIVSGERVVPELLQEAATPAAVADAVERMLKEREYREAMIAKLGRVRERLGSGGGSRRVAELAAGMVE